MGQVPRPATPEEALDWVRRMMVISTPEHAREIDQLVRDHEQVIMGGWDRRQRKYFPGMMSAVADMTRNVAQLKLMFIALSVVVVLGTTAPTWWPMLRGLFP